MWPLAVHNNDNQALYGTTGGTYSAQVFRPVMPTLTRENSSPRYRV